MLFNKRAFKAVEYHSPNYYFQIAIDFYFYYYKQMIWNEQKLFWGEYFFIPWLANAPTSKSCDLE
jgi:hypothetical protein